MHQSTSSRLSPIASIESGNGTDERRTLYPSSYSSNVNSTPIPANALAINAEIAGEVRRRREVRKRQIINVMIAILVIVMMTMCVTWLVLWMARRLQRSEGIGVNNVASDEYKKPARNGKMEPASSLLDKKATSWNVPQGLWRKGSDDKWYYYRLIGPSVPYKPRMQRGKRTRLNTNNNYNAKKLVLTRKQS
jgi:hypothetical protein